MYNFKISVIIEPDEGGYHVYCPALKGLHTCGDTEEEAVNTAKDAVIAYLHSLIKHGDPIPIGIVAEEEVKGRIHHIRDLVVATA